MTNFALIVDDDRTERRMLGRILKTHFNFEIDEAENGKEALGQLQNKNYRLLLLDLNMPVMDGRAVIRSISQKYPDLLIVVLTGSEKTQDAVFAMKEGANDFLSKPIDETRFITSVKNALKLSLLSQEVSALKRENAGVYVFSDLIGHDQGLKSCVQIGQKAAACNLPTLIIGETGTGKEMFARAIHGESARADHPFIAVNCGAIPEKLVESVLFGHEKGAFTGAIQKSMGKFREANGGTIFLDEIGELPMEAQVKLLRVLQQQEVEPVGAGSAEAIDVRILSATNRDLKKEVEEGRFREDLYFRLNVLHIVLPPLRARLADMKILIDCFLEKFSSSNQLPDKTLTEDAYKKLLSYDWPGNIRELENTVNRTLALSENAVLSDIHFDIDLKQQQEIEGLINPLTKDGNFKSLKTLERDIIIMAINHHHGNMAQTARALGIAKSTLYAKAEDDGEQTTKQKSA